jgi:hypothetical protein
MSRPALAMLMAASLAAALVFDTHGRYWQLSDQLNPFAPLVVGDEPNWLTPFKLSRLSNDPELCRAVLRDSGASAMAVTDMDAGGGCGWVDAVRLRGWFEGVLGPDFNRQHVDHFHLDRGSWKTCR